MIINVPSSCVLASAVLGLARHGDNSVCHIFGATNTCRAPADTGAEYSLAL